MNGSASLQPIDFLIFAIYMCVSVGLGFWVARKGKNTAQGYFLGNKTIPWFVIGSSMVAADISSEQFISNVGAAYKHGIVVAAGDWNAWIIYSLLIFIFLPYYVRTGVYTMPEFLERRYNAACRYIFAVASIFGFVAAINAGALYSGGRMLDSFLGDDLNKVLPTFTVLGNEVSPVVVYIFFFAFTTGIYTIYGGLKSAAWTDFLQIIILLVAGFLVPILALQHAGDLTGFAQEHPEHFQVFKPPTHKPFPVTGLFTGFLSVGIWYSCTSQHMVQRVLAAKDEWHARVGVVLAGFLHVIMPFFFIVPGIIALKMFPTISHPDQAYLVLIKQLVPTGLKGLLLAGMGAALMGHVATVLNSASTIVTIDLYKNLVNRNATEEQQVRIGRWSGAIILIASVWIAVGFTHSSETLFDNIQTVLFFIAPPFAVVFTLGILWRRANSIAAVTTMIVGFLCSTILYWNFGTEEKPHHLLDPYNTFNHRALATWIVSMITMFIVSAITPAPPEEKIRGIIWNKSFLQLPPDVSAKYRGLKDWRIWWALFVGIVLSIYGFFIWFRIKHPW